MQEYYEKSIQMIKYLNILLTEKQYNELAVKHNLLSAESLQYISKKNFEQLNRELIEEVA